MPGPQPNQQECCEETKPLHTVVGALVGVSELLLAVAEVVHLADNLAHHLLDSAQLGFYGLQLLAGLDGSPVLGVGTNVNVELDVTVGVLDVFVCWSRVSGVPEDQRLVDALPVRMFSKHTSKAASAWEVKTVRCSPAMSLGLPYSFPAASIMCMFSCMPSPLYPSTIAVTTTNMSLATKFRMHLLERLSCPLPAWMSNFRASVPTASRSSALQTFCSTDRA